MKCISYLYDIEIKVMDKDFIPYKQALELKELGFDEKCMMYYGDSLSGYTLQSTDYWYSNSHWMFNANDNKDRHLMCAAPLYQQAFRFFREKYEITYSINGAKDYIIVSIDAQEYGEYGELDGAFKAYEKAELACLKKLIKLVKKKQHD